MGKTLPRIILVSGIPGTGKSSFCRYLARQYLFAHYDMEHREDWPHKELHPIWEASRPQFVAELKQRHEATALDWGFPPHCLGLVEELLDAGVFAVWFTGDLALARQAFISRGTIPEEPFDKQVQRISDAGLPGSLNARVVQVFTPEGAFKSPEVIYRSLS